MARRLTSTGVVAALLLLGACAEQATVSELHRLPGFAGEVSVAELAERGAADSPPTRYMLSFSRGNGYFSVQVQLGGRTVTLLRGADGKPQAFENAVPRPATPDEHRRFALVRDLTDIEAIQAVRPDGPDAYRAQLHGRWYRIVLDPRSVTPHRRGH
ncbi:MAG: hypothetical protein KDC87_07575 [Planctomycetes bacterium]|nr:hypothetical protein [Planctomycetota bacterium]MCB9871374.1 hypothetical protein [Planctomycetota bacterium]